MKALLRSRALLSLLCLVPGAGCSVGPPDGAAAGYPTGGDLRDDSIVYPAARRIDQVDTYHGVEIADPYRWMEEMTSGETTAWLRSQEELLERYLQGVGEREAMRRRIRELIGSILYLAPVKAGGRYFSMGMEAAGGNGSVLEVRDDWGATPRLLLDLRRPSPVTSVRLRGFYPSHDGRLVACTTSEDQSGWLAIRILDAVTGADRSGARLETHSISGGLTWARDGSGFFYTRYDRPDGVAEDKATPIRPRLLFHSLGSGRDEPIYELSDEPDVILSHTLTADGRYLVITLNEGSSTRNRVLYKDLEATAGGIVTLIAEADASYTFLGSVETLFWFYTDRDAPRGRIVAVDITRPGRAAWREVVGESAEQMAANSAVGGNALGMFGDRFVVTYLKEGVPLLRVFDTGGRLAATVELPLGGWIWGGLSGSQHDPEVFYQFLGLTDMATIYRLDLKTARNTVVRRAETPIDPRSVAIARVSYRSKDGTEVPMFIARRQGQPDGARPAILYGYGAFGWVSFVWYQPFVLNWLEMGGVYAQPGIRGGGEFGEAWHEAGMKRQEQNSIDDFIAAAEWLIDNGYTAPAKLAATGGSASGGLAAAAILQRPDLFAAAVIDRPVLDMVRFDRFTQAAYWLPEFGSPGDREDFEALRAWSPYHNVRKGACYPPTLVMSGDLDQVAVPLHAYKFTAAMQEAQGCAKPVLLKVMRGAGHNFGTTPEQNADSWADEAAFLLRTMMPGRSAPPGRIARIGADRSD